MIDAPGGGGKTPLIPNYIEDFGEDEIVLRNFRAERYVYKQPEEMAPPVRRTDPEYLFSPDLELPRMKRVARAVKTA